MTSRFVLGCSIGTVCIALSPIVEGRQQPQFKSSTDVVRVYATVQDRTGHLVTDLRQDEFELRDRGTVVALTAFSTDAQPLSIAIMVDMASGVFDRRTFAVLHEALDAFADRLGPDDRVSVGWFTKTDVVPGRDFLSDKSSLKAAFRTELTLSRIRPETSSAQSYQIGRTMRPLWNAVSKAIESFRSAPGRKVVLVLPNGPATGHLGGLPGHREARTMAQRDEVMVYAVVGYEPRRAEGLPGLRQNRDPYYSPPISTITDETGGGLIDISGHRASPRMPLSDGVVAVLAGVADELRHQYTLGFVPTKRDGKVASIDVTTKRLNTRVWARRSYLAPVE